ncbi:family 1 glycosylhydrolase [Nocardia terpenica]|uniref:beta-glucosidase n=1 Tax=Nocardia terpenica TaxID=455432 RepID=A0A6G9Z8Y1_9NOCA|nr:family 1 glycosylhydrolase [Nocardia terpenica]QIS21942.1 family 1 glycosylhydrolase [Nocardia terpenica]
MHPGARLCAMAAAAMTAVAVALGAGPAQANSAPDTVDPLPADFLWGVASSGFQTEGHAPDSNWTRYIARSGYEPYRNSVDFYDRYAEDIELAHRLGVKVYRISIEWARLQPAPDRWDEDAFRFYDRVIGEIVGKGMRPMLTLDHWVYPGWALDAGGWHNPGMVDWWLANMRRVVDRYADRNPLWVTINEPVAYAVHELTEAHVPGGEFDARFGEIVDRFVRAHRSSYDYIRQRQPDALVTSNIGYISGDTTGINDRIIDRIADKVSFVGVDYYFDATTDEPRPVARSAAGTDIAQLWELPLAAEGVYYALRHYAQRFPTLPLFVVENGMSTDNGLGRPDGYDRADYLRDTAYWLQRARMDGYNVIGYNYWSLTDNYEWGSYAPRFGLYTVNVDFDPFLIRFPTPAADAYRAVTAAEGVRPGYLPTRRPAPCSRIDRPSSCSDPVVVPDRAGNR